MRVNDAAGCLHPMPETPALLYVSFFGSQANAASSRGYVRFSAESGHRGLAPKCPLCAKSGHNAVQQIRTDLGSIFAVLG